MNKGNIEYSIKPFKRQALLDSAWLEDSKVYPGHFISCQARSHKLVELMHRKQIIDQKLLQMFQDINSFLQQEFYDQGFFWFKVQPKKNYISIP